MALEDVICPRCGGTAKYDSRQSAHACVDVLKCTWKNVDECAYPKCTTKSLYPSKLCYTHREWASYFEWVFGSVLKGTVDNLKDLQKLIKGK